MSLSIGMPNSSTYIAQRPATPGLDVLNEVTNPNRNLNNLVSSLNAKGIKFDPTQKGQVITVKLPTSVLQGTPSSENPNSFLRIEALGNGQLKVTATTPSAQSQDLSSLPQYSNTTPANTIPKDGWYRQSSAMERSFTVNLATGEATNVGSHQMVTTQARLQNTPDDLKTPEVNEQSYAWKTETVTKPLSAVTKSTADTSNLLKTWFERAGSAVQQGTATVNN
jgi:hypothetical protein